MPDSHQLFLLDYVAVALESTEDQSHPVAKGCDTVGMRGMSSERPVRLRIYENSYGFNSLEFCRVAKGGLAFPAA